MRCRSITIKTVKLLLHFLAEFEIAVIFAFEIMDGDYLGYPIFQKNPIFLQRSPDQFSGRFHCQADISVYIKPQKMKKIFTNLTAILFLIITLFAPKQSQAQQGSGGGSSNNYNVSFTGVPTLIGNILNLLLGAKYKFTDVASGVRAEVTILSATGGATVATLDDNSLTKPEAFSPAITIPAHSNGVVTFRIDFYSGTSNTPKVLDRLTATAMDIDGNSTLHEIDALDMGNGTVSFMSNNPEISVVRIGNEFTGTNIAGNEYTGVDTSAKQVMFTVTKESVSSFIYRAGGNNTGNSAVTRQKGIYFKGFTYPPAAPLPVKLISFDGAAKDNAVLLNWLTEEEINNSHFEVERSFNAKDFTNIAVVLDGIENGTKKSYALKDASPLLKDKSIAYYRLKQVDLDGKFTYSNVLPVRLKNAAGITMQVSPNPFVERLITRFNSEEKGTGEIRIISLAGKTVSTKVISINKGFNNIQLDGLSALPSGAYAATLTMNGQVIATEKIIK